MKFSLKKKPAVSDLARRLLEEEGVDPKWLEQETERRREAHAAFKQQERIDRLARRKQTPAGQQLGELERKLLLGPQVKARAPDSGGGKSPPGTREPPQADHFEHGSADRAEMQRLWNLLLDCIGKLEEIVDRLDGLL